MLEGFICPDGEKVLLEDCFNHCRLEHRCMTLPTLTLMSREREWNGVASTTQLLNGTMMEFLKLTNPYYVDPNDRVFMIGGSVSHRSLEEVAKELGLPAEIPLSIDRDIFDLLEWEGKEPVLTDYKRWGSYRVVKALGIVKVGEQPDPSGAVYKTDSKYGKKGEPKMIPIWGRDESKVDIWEAQLQLNRYRVMLKRLIKLIIKRMQLQIEVRDGGLVVAYNRGIYRNCYMIDIPEIPDLIVEGYFSEKDKALHTALDQGHWELPCSVKESWEGARCEGWCDVWMYCPKGRLVHGIGG